MRGHKTTTGLWESGVGVVQSGMDGAHLHLADAKHQTSLNEGQPEHIFTESISNFPIHVLADGRKVDGHVGGRRGVLADLKDDLLGVVVADGELEEVQLEL